MDADRCEVHIISEIPFDKLVQHFHTQTLSSAVVKPDEEVLRPTTATVIQTSGVDYSDGRLAIMKHLVTVILIFVAGSLLPGVSPQGVSLTLPSPPSQAPAEAPLPLLPSNEAAAPTGDHNSQLSPPSPSPNTPLAPSPAKNSPPSPVNNAAPQQAAASSIPPPQPSQASSPGQAPPVAAPTQLANGQATPPSSTNVQVAAPAPAPTESSSTTQDVTALVTSPGSLTTALICPGVQAALPQIQDCTLISQEQAPQPNFSGSRRLHQATQHLNIVVRLSPLTAAQVPAAVSALQGLTIETIVIVQVVGAAPVAPGSPTPTAAPIPGLPPASPNTNTNAPPPAPTGGVVAVPSEANGTTKTLPSNQVPTPQGNGTRTQTTVQNSTTTTTITTFTEIDIETITVFVIQYIFTKPVNNANAAVIVTIINFNLPGTTTVPVAILGGGTLGQVTTVQVPGPTIFLVSISTKQLVATSTTTTTTTTTTSTTTTTTTTTPPAPGSTTPGTTTTPPAPASNTTNVLSNAQTVPGVTQQVCSTPNNPYSILPITQSQGTLKAGCNLVSSWNDVATNTPGRGNIIWQCCPGQPSGTVWANITVSSNGACSKQGTTEVGVTMGLCQIEDRLYQANLPIEASKNFGPGCLLQLDTSGNLIAEATDAAASFVWGLSCTSNNGQDTLFVSSVGNTAAGTANTGRRLAAAAPAPAPAVGGAAETGSVQRYTFSPPSQGSWSLGKGVPLITGLTSTPTIAGLSGGTVAPGQTVLVGTTLYIPALLQNEIFAVENALSDNPSPAQVVFSGAPLNQPNSIQFNPTARDNTSFVIANTGDGNLIFLDVGTKTATALLVDPTNPAAGFLFNAIFNDGILYYVDDGTNTLNRKIPANATAPAPAPTIALAPSR